jgi:hypothetical protein
MLSKLIVFALFITAIAVTADKSKYVKNAITNKEKLEILGSDAATWTFDFTKSQDPKYTFTPGSVINANAGTWAPAVGTGMTLAQLNLGPCSMLPPHWHPRATNFVVSVHGSVKTWVSFLQYWRRVVTLLTGVSLLDDEREWC